VYFLENQDEYEYDLNTFKNKYYNESLADLVRNINATDRIIEYEGKLLQRVDPVFNDPSPTAGFFNYRTHFFAPKKQFAGQLFDTYYFNILVIWLISIGLYICLYYEVLRKTIQLFGNLKIPEIKK
jgi:hypothetical protein